MAGPLPPLVRFPLAVLASTLGWMAGMALGFVPAQAILTDPTRQSAKMLAVFSTLEPRPLLSTPDRVILLVGFISIFLVLGYRLSRPDPRESWWSCVLVDHVDLQWVGDCARPWIAQVTVLESDTALLPGG